MITSHTCHHLIFYWITAIHQTQHRALQSFRWSFKARSRCAEDRRPLQNIIKNETPTTTTSTITHYEEANF